MSVLHGNIPEDTEEVKGHKAYFLGMLEENFGIVLRTINACKKKKHPIPYTSFLRWKKNDPVFCKKVDEMIDLKARFVEMHFQQCVAAHEPSCVNKGMQYLGRRLGYEVTESMRLKVDAAPDTKAEVPEDLIDKALERMRKDGEEETKDG